MNINKEKEDKNTKIKSNIVCDKCDKASQTINLSPCPFASEIHNDHTKLYICDDCYYSALDDI